MTTEQLDSLFDRLFPICRSISGAGLRESLAIFAEQMPLQLESTPSGTQVFDWTVPHEWHIDSATLTAPDGRVVADFADHNLRVVNYSAPVEGRYSLEALRPRLHTLPHLPDLIPYVTSYYQPNWGFCLTHNELAQLAPGDYQVRIDSRFQAGEINYGTALLGGESRQEFLLSSYLCHPSMANNELSGPLVLLGLYHRLARWPKRRFSYRFVLAPETIGSLCYLHRYGEHLKSHCIGGLVLTCLGGPASALSVKLARQEECLLNQLVRQLASEQPERWVVREFTPCHGSDERQYCSPGFDLPVVQAARTVYGNFAEYHTSGDTKEFMQISRLIEAIDQLEQLLLQHENAGVFERTNPYGEPQLGKRGLYPNLNSPASYSKSSDQLLDGRTQLMAMQWILNLADGRHTLLQMVRRARMPLATLLAVVPLLEEAELIRFTAPQCR
ncbi:DUF4910 domain-containing protein [Aeromonas enteropelogenes]|uniref:DUF4910 domain-containing protein n=1 Tax=Aeromonas enteropelogenes TaxID=29489 RepID=UPI0005A6BDE2|nr:DUF4910 domain-containing protein [Aeromonas enteropelogenes]UBH53355.1 DUF4910 domain-containing protein [Aeromonas enteropelogenes]